MKYGITTAILASCAVLLGSLSVSAADKLELMGIGSMSVPQGISYEKGAQNTLPFMKEGGTQRFFVRRGMTQSDYYTMTWKKGPDFSYGWALSQKLGVPFLLEIGEISHKNDSPEGQMDVIASWLNQALVKKGASYEGNAPLKKIKDSKHPRWEGFVTLKTVETGITYNEAYSIILQCDNYFTTLGIINTDADRSDITEEVRKMVLKRKMPEKASLLRLSQKGTSLTEIE